MNAPLSAPQHQLAARPAAAISTSSTGTPGELPPSARRPSSWPNVGGFLQAAGRSRNVAMAAAVGLAGLAATLFGLGGPGESSARSWRHHQQATEQWEQAGNRPATLQPAMKWIIPAGAAHFQSTVLLAAPDADAATSREVLSAMQGYDTSAIDAAVEQAQTGLPAAPIAHCDASAKPTLSTGMRDDIRRGDSRFYHIFIYDSCDEDGDVVDIIIDGHRFATVPITRQGTTLSIPLGIGRPTTVVVRGVYDGGGGITVACQTSRGEGFLRALAPDEEQSLAFVVE